MHLFFFITIVALCYYINMKIDIYVPSNISEIKLQQYQEFEELNNSKNLDQISLTQKMVEIFCGLELKDVVNIRFKDCKSIAEHLNNIFKKEYKLQTQFTLNNVTYGFIPSLDEITLGEYIDLDTYLNDWKNIHKAMCVLYRPVTKSFAGKYSIKEYDSETSDVFLNCPMDIVLGALSFFLSLSEELINLTQNSLMEEMKKTKGYHQYQFLEKNGVGINQYTQLLKATLEGLMK